MDFEVSYFLEVMPKILGALGVTLELSVIALVIAIILGLVSAVSNYYNIKGINFICKIYISIFRGTPLMPQLFFFCYGIAYISETVKNMDPLLASAIVLGLNVGAYMSENIRGAFMSVDKGQLEAAFSFGMSKYQTMVKVVMPQAMRSAFPSLFNNLIDLIKGTSIAFTVGVADIMGMAKMEGAFTFRFFEVYAAVMIIYWVIITILSFVQKKLEIRCNLAY
ncbi:amino acid ABC transporter permease [Peptoclostridium sp. AF21-18]|uniref:amino acid ABC transporter permease n=1 Tax=Peptoclostridium sp. AF21-18 TaxID=2292243 RepID=UPI000E552C8F|nr:amino acid ABC transporter permease [Peptoclostridium sp. AF21-18]RHQ98750.1 amino acid ABC transporter permease [Peptoclostridium sp. AF21-18]